MTRFAWKINREPGENRIHRLDTAKTPTPVRATAPISQLRQRFNMAAFNFSSGGEFFKFFSHN